MKITIGNNKSDKLGINYLLQNYNDLRVANKELKAQMMEVFGIKNRFSFDIVRINGLKRDQSEINVSKKDITLIKVSTTARYLPESPVGSVINRFEAPIQNNFEFCFVCINPKSRSAVFVKYPELKTLVDEKKVKIN